MIGIVAAIALGLEDPALAPVLDGYRGPYHLVSKPEREIELTIEYKASKKSGDVAGWIVVVPTPPKIPAQPDAKMTVKFERGKPELTKFRESSKFNREMSAYTVGLAEPEIAYSVKYHATMCSRRLAPGAATTPPEPLSRSERALFTGPTPTCDYTSDVVLRWIRTNNLKRWSGESELSFAHRAFEAIRAAFTYMSPTDREFFKCSATIARGTSDCGATNLLLAAVLRSNKIPARVFCGWHALVGKPGLVQSHSRGEFYVDSIGWIPVDATAPETPGDSKDNTFLFGLDPGWYFTDEIDTDFDFKIPGNVEISDAWIHQLTAPYLSNGRPDWEGFSIASTNVCKNLRLLGDGWYARNSVRN